MIGPNPPVHPGEILREEFLHSLKLSAYAVNVATIGQLSTDVEQSLKALKTALKRQGNWAVLRDLT